MGRHPPNPCVVRWPLARTQQAVERIRAMDLDDEERDAWIAETEQAGPSSTKPPRAANRRKRDRR
jgi:hypothetical protein